MRMSAVASHLSTTALPREPREPRPSEAQTPTDRLRRLLSGAVRGLWAAVAALVVFAVCVGPPAAAYASRWLWRVGRASGERARSWARAGAGRAWEATLALVAWLTKVVPPAASAASERLSQLAAVTHERAKGVARGGKERARRLLDAIEDTRIANSRPVALAPRSVAAPQSPDASQLRRNRFLALGSLAAVFAVALTIVLSNLGASAGGVPRPATRHHASRALPKTAQLRRR